MIATAISEASSLDLLIDILHSVVCVPSHVAHAAYSVHYHHHDRIHSALSDMRSERQLELNFFSEKL